MKSPTVGRRPADLAAAHGISPQTVRNYEQAGVIPLAERTAAGYRLYSQVHAAALAAYLALLPGFGHGAGAEIMRAANRGDLDAAFQLIDAAHAQLRDDRTTLDAVEVAVRHLSEGADRSDRSHGSHGADRSDRPHGADRSHRWDRSDCSECTDNRPGGARARALPIGAVAHRLGVTPATLRTWERAGILTPQRDHGARTYRPADLRDADLAHLLRRGGYPLAHIATVLDQTRRAGGAGALADSLADWRRRLTARARAMLTGAAGLDAYLNVLSRDVGPS